MQSQRRQFLAWAGGILAGSVASRAVAAPPANWSQPVHRVANASLAPSREAPSRSGRDNPQLRQALQMADESLRHSVAQVNDYTAVLVKRERIGDTVGEHEYMSLKVRNRKVVNGNIVQPMSVYLMFLKPSSVKGREVIYVENQNDGNLVAHEGGFKGKFLPTVTIPPTGMLAMRGQRYPLTDIGVENMIVKLIERGEKALKYEDVTCEFRKGARLQNRVCTVLQVNQPVKRPGLEFYQAQVFLDEEFNLPIRYIAYDWPKVEGQPGEVIEEYNYLNLKINVGLTDADFDPYNKGYNFYS